jgi:hypothetical protein
MYEPFTVRVKEKSVVKWSLESVVSSRRPLRIRDESSFWYGTLQRLFSESSVGREFRLQPSPYMKLPAVFKSLLVAPLNIGTMKLRFSKSSTRDTEK